MWIKIIKIKGTHVVLGYKLIFIRQGHILTVLLEYSLRCELATLTTYAIYSIG